MDGWAVLSGEEYDQVWSRVDNGDWIIEIYPSGDYLLSRKGLFMGYFRSSIGKHNYHLQ